MKMKQKMIYAAVVCACGLFVFLFYTPFGLVLQTFIILKVQSVYLPFYCSRVAATRGAYCKHFSSEQLYSMGWSDLQAARDTVSAGIAQQSDSVELRRRAYIEMSILSYSNAVVDFAQALKLSKQPPDFDFPLQTSNHLEMAKACAAAKEKYWRYRETRSTNSVQRSESGSGPEATHVAGSNR